MSWGEEETIEHMTDFCVPDSRSREGRRSGLADEEEGE